MARRLQDGAQFLAGAVRGLTHPSEKVNAQSQALDFAATKLVRFADRRLYDSQQKLQMLANRLSPPHHQLAVMTRRFDTASERLSPLVAAMLERQTARYESATKLLEANSFTRVLERGFALVRDEAGAPIKQAADLTEGDAVVITFADDSRHAHIGTVPDSASQTINPQAVSKKPAARPKKPRPAKADDGQSELF